MVLEFFLVDQSTQILVKCCIIQKGFFRNSSVFITLNLMIPSV